VANLYLSLSSWQSRMEITVETEKAQFLLRGRGKFYGAQRLTMWFGKTGVDAVGRIVGIIVAAIAVQLIVNGVAGLTNLKIR